MKIRISCRRYPNQKIEVKVSPSFQGKGKCPVCKKEPITFQFVEFDENK